MSPLLGSQSRRQVKAVCVVRQDVTEKDIWDMLEAANVLDEVVHVKLTVYSDNKIHEGNSADIVFTNPGSAELVHYKLHFRLLHEAKIRIIYIAPDDTPYKPSTRKPKNRTDSSSSQIKVGSTSGQESTSTQSTGKSENQGRAAETQRRTESQVPIVPHKPATESKINPNPIAVKIESPNQPSQIQRSLRSVENQIHFDNSSHGNRYRTSSGSTEHSFNNDWIPPANSPSIRSLYSGEKFTNLYVKNIPHFFTEEILTRSFSIHGKIKSCRIMTDEVRKSRGFGFVAYERPEDAAKAYALMNGLVMANERILYVAPAQKRTEREIELRKKYTLLEAEENKWNGQGGVFMLVSNLDFSIREQDLWDLCRPYGRIQFVAITPGNGLEKGHGFVRFLSRDEAALAVIKLHGCRLGTQNLDVRITPRKGSAKGISRPGQNVIIPATRAVRTKTRKYFTDDTAGINRSGTGDCARVSDSHGGSIASGISTQQMKQNAAPEDFGEQPEVPVIPARITSVTDLIKRAQGMNLNRLNPTSSTQECGSTDW